MASAAVTSKKTKSPTANKNYATNLAKGGSVTVKDGVKTYSDKSLQVKGKGGISISGQSYSRDKGGSGFAPTTSVITADKMKPVPPIPLATPAPIDGMFGITNAANAGLAALNGGTYDTKTNQIVPPPLAPAAPADNNQAILNSYLQANAGLEAPSAVSNLKEMQKTLRPKENLVNSLSGQLNTLNASRDAEMLKLEGQGRGQTSGFIGGEQARINREAAIQAMPIQAQLAIAQDDLDSARTYASQYFQAKMQDETNIYNQKKENNRLIFDYLTSAEQRRLDANEKALDREYNEKQATAKSAEAIALQAIEYGQSSLASKVMGLDPKSATYAQDVNAAMGQLVKPVAATSAPKRDTAFDKDGNLVDMQTGEILRSSQTVENMGGQAGARQYEIKKADIQMGYNTAKELLNNKVGLDLATGAFQSPAMKTLLTNVGGSIAGFGAAGSVVPGIGTALGAATGAVAGLATAPFAYSYNKTQQDNFLAGTSFLINDSTFGEIRDLKAQGVTFGNMTEGERIAAGRAATNLASAAELDESGKVTGFRGDANKIKGYIQDIMTAYEGRQEYLDKQYAISPVDEDEAANVWGGNN